MPDDGYGYLYTMPFGERVVREDIFLTPYPAKHIRFDRDLVKDTLLQMAKPRSIEHFSMLRRILYDLVRFPVGACIAWHIECGGKGLLHLGSLASLMARSFPDVELIVPGYGEIVEV